VTAVALTAVPLTAVSRSDFGKGAARRIRREGNIPAVIYGQGADLVHIALPTHDLNMALRKPRVVFSITFDGTTVLVKPRDIQRDPVSRHLEHLDLIIISASEADDRGAMAAAIQAATHRQAFFESDFNPLPATGFGLQQPRGAYRQVAFGRHSGQGLAQRDGAVVARRKASSISDRVCTRLIDQSPRSIARTPSSSRQRRSCAQRGAS